AADAGVFTFMGLVENNSSLVFNSNQKVYPGAIRGSGAVALDGSGAVIFTSESTYTGGTTVNNGALFSTYALPGNVSVAAGAKLGGYTPFFDDRVGLPGVAGDLSNEGETVVAGGNAVIGGDYSQAATGTLAGSLGSKLDGAGTATLAGGTLEVIGADDFYVANDHTEVLTAAGGVTGTFDQLVKGPGVVFTSSTINQDANSVWLDTTGLDVTMAAAGGAVGYTPVSMGSAVRVQG